jgi:hypothetical protein
VIVVTATVSRGCGRAGQRLFLLFLLFLFGRVGVAAVEDERGGDENEADLLGETVHRPLLLSAPQRGRNGLGYWITWAAM